MKDNVSTANLTKNNRQYLISFLEINFKYSSACRTINILLKYFPKFSNP